MWSPQVYVYFLKFFFCLGYKFVDYCLSLLARDTQNAEVIEIAFGCYITDAIGVFQ